MPVILQIFITLLFIGLFGFLAYYITQRIFTIPNFKENIQNLEKLIKLQRKKLKKQTLDEKEECELKEKTSKIKDEIQVIAKEIKDGAKLPHAEQ